MADWVGSSNSRIRPYRNASVPFIRDFEESTAGATAVVRRGDAVTFDTVVATASHRIVRAPSSGGTGTNVMQVAIKSLLGVAVQDSTSDGSTTGLNGGGTGLSRLRHLSVVLATPGQEFLGFASTMAPGSSAANQALVGRQVPLIFDRTNHVFTIGTANTTVALAAVQITEVPENVLGDSGAYPLVFTFLSTNVSPVVPGASQ
jgi:hypothetical protein